MVLKLVIYKSRTNSLLTQGALKFLLKPVFDAFCMENVTFITIHLNYRVIFCENFETYGACFNLLSEITKSKKFTIQSLKGFRILLFCH